MSVADLVHILDLEQAAEVSVVAQRGQEFYAATASSLTLAMALARTLALSGWVSVLRTDGGEVGDPGIICTVERRD